MLKYMMQKVGA